MVHNYTDDFDYSKICFMSNFPPKECGIATFTRDLSSAMDKKFNPKLKSRIIALNNEEEFYNYSNKVIMQVNRDDLEDFINVAKKINKSDKIKLICIQHEFGLFGGAYGSYLIPFLEIVEKPVVVAFHSILPNPDELRKRVVRFIASKCAAVIVMAKGAVEILNKDYGIEKSKINVIYHGIPNVPFCKPDSFKRKLRLESKIVLSTFGLLSRGKGIEYMIEAMPELVKKYPNLIYLIIGETHPMIRKQEGEQYRNELIRKVKELGLEDNVKFYNKYLSLREIISYLLATDIYICTNLDKNQSVSGTLSYALGCGKAVVSTPSIYAEEVLSDNRGILVKLKNSKSFVEAIERILGDKVFRANLEKNAYAFTRHMTWSNVSMKYLDIFNKGIKLREEVTEKYPSIKLNHIKRLTDNFGILQFSKLSTPDKSSGYTVDDNARALISAVLNYNLFKSKTSFELAKIYLSFLGKVQWEDGFFNDVLESNLTKSSEDSLGRALWALGYTINKSDNLEMVNLAKKLFDKSYNKTNEFKSPRAISFSIIGLYYYCKKYKSQEYLDRIKRLADDLLALYEHVSSNDWRWFENYMTYANSKLPESLFLAYELTKDKRYLEIAEKTLGFLSNLLFVNDHLSLIGQKGWYKRNGEKAFFDQQPIDASYMVQTYLVAYSITHNKEYYNKAVLSFNWFLGKNHLKQMIYDENTGGCYDGLSENSVNLNQGAESTIAYLMARLFLEEVKRQERN